MKYCVQIYHWSTLCIIWLNVCLYIGNFNAGTPNYHHYLLSSYLGTILLGRKECDITYVHILDNFNFNFNFNSYCSPICKLKYQIMFDHYADHHLLYLCRPPSVIIIQTLYSCQSYNIVISILTKLILLFVILKCAEYQKKP